MKSDRHSQLLALSFDTAASPWITLLGGPAGESRPAGWGFAWYPGNDTAAVVIKDPTATRDTSFTEVIGDWGRFRSTVFLCHIRGAAKRVTQQDTHPFARSYSGRNFVLAHSGDLTPDFPTALPLGDMPVFEPLGKTDSEHAFCWLLTRIRALGARTLDTAGWPQLLALLRQIDSLGTANLLLTDGLDLVAYRDESAFSSLYWQRRVPPIETSVLRNTHVELELSDPLDHSRSIIIFSTTPLDDGEWTEMAPGHMLVVRRAMVRWDSQKVEGLAPGAAVVRPPMPDGAPGEAIVITGPSQIEVLGTTATSDVSTSLLERAATAPLTGAPPPPSAVPAEPPSTPPTRFEYERVLSIVHETVYTYTQPVEYSTHTLRLHPVHDLSQEVLDCQVSLTPSGPITRYEDVFGNQSMDLELQRSYTEFRVESRSLLRVRARPELHGLGHRVTIPLVWMPWQRQMMSPYLLPSELPESQLRELSEYAMSFVERQDYDLIESLIDVNQTICRDFKYESRSTSLETTPFDVYTHRVGVCQDFANLFICLARLLGIPARYRVGYIYTGADYVNTIQSEASHAWAEVFLPRIGWRGFDPTNGCLAGVNHVRVAAGRNYRDATPTSGTIYRGGVGEALSVKVRVEPA